MQLEVGKTYITQDKRRADCIGATRDGKFAVSIQGRKMIETYGADGTFRIDTDQDRYEGLHIVGEYIHPIRLWAVVDGFGDIRSTATSRDGLDPNEVRSGRVVELAEVGR